MSGICWQVCSGDSVSNSKVKGRTVFNGSSTTTEGARADETVQRRRVFHYGAVKSHSLRDKALLGNFLP